MKATTKKKAETPQKAGRKQKQSSGSTQEKEFVMPKPGTKMTYSAFGEGGAHKLAIFYQQRMGKKILTIPKYNPETTLWEFDLIW